MNVIATSFSTRLGAHNRLVVGRPDEADVFSGLSLTPNVAERQRLLLRLL